MRLLNELINWNTGKKMKAIIPTQYCRFCGKIHTLYRKLYTLSPLPFHLYYITRYTTRYALAVFLVITRSLFYFIWERIFEIAHFFTKCLFSLRYICFREILYKLFMIEEEVIVIIIFFLCVMVRVHT